MVKVLDEENSILDAQDKLNQYNSNIIDAIKNINSELEIIDKVLNTPKANKEIPKYIEEFKNELSYLEGTKERFDTSFKVANIEYREHIEQVRKMVGSNYEA